MIWYIIPVYNEENNLHELIHYISTSNNKLPWRAVFVNDGSTDKTSDILFSASKLLPIDVLGHKGNLGVHCAFVSAFSHVLTHGQPNDIVVTIEGDSTSDLSILPNMLELLKDNYDVVLASCYAKGGCITKTSLFRTFTSEAANWLIRVFFSMGKLRTYSSFYRVYRFLALKKAFEHYNGKLIEEKGFVCMVEMLIKFLAMGLRVTEVPMVLDTSKRKGKSKMKVFHTAWRYLAFIAKNTWKYRIRNSKGNYSSCIIF